MSTTIAISHLHYRTTLQDLSLQVNPGEVVGLVGSGGSGKTTLLRILAGDFAPSAGTATIAGIDCHTPAVRCVVGAMGEAWGILPYHTVREQLTLFARLRGLPAQRVAEVMRTCDLHPLGEIRTGRLRPGEVARLKMAGAMLHDPPAMLLDEPIGDIDRESGSILSFAISELADRGKAILLATFGDPRALELATRMLYLERGRLAELEGEAGPTPVAAPAGPQAEPIPPVSPIQHVAARSDDRVRLFAPSEIRYAFAQEKAVFIATGDGTFSVNFTLTDLESRLSDAGFVRCHRGYLVNLSYVKEIASWTRDSYSLLMKDGKEIPLSKHRAADLRRRLGW